MATNFILVRNSFLYEWDASACTKGCCPREWRSIQERHCTQRFSSAEDVARAIFRLESKVIEDLESENIPRHFCKWDHLVFTKDTFSDGLDAPKIGDVPADIRQIADEMLRVWLDARDKVEREREAEAERAEAARDAEEAAAQEANERALLAELQAKYQT